jgi:thiamine biosynthesis protein ThiC
MEAKRPVYHHREEMQEDATKAETREGQHWRQRYRLAVARQKRIRFVELELAEAQTGDTRIWVYCGTSHRSLH